MTVSVDPGEPGRGIPLISLRPWTDPDAHSDADRHTVAREVGAACRRVGFFLIGQHGVNPALIEAVAGVSRAFFDLPLETKLALKTDDEATYPYGYENTEQLVVGRNLHRAEAVDRPGPDRKETFSLGPTEASGMPARRFPPQPEQFQAVMSAYYVAMEELASTLMRVFSVALKLPVDYFEPFLEGHWSALRTLNYPALQLDIDGTSEPGLVRAGEHTDYGALTILCTDGPGLQVQPPAEVGADPHWIDVPVFNTDEGVFVVNLGDMMQRWTNDAWVSTLHRVVAVPDSTEVIDRKLSFRRRQSLAYFCNIAGGAVVRPLETCCGPDRPAKYAPILAKDHLMAKHLASMGYGAVAAAAPPPPQPS